jgi:S1-C subfamily serine protease/ATP-dependent Clp protease adapter protein ClpS
VITICILHATAFIPSHSLNNKYNKFHRHQSSILQASTTPTDLAQSVLPSVALILPVGVRNTTARGSGFVIDWKESRDDDDNGEPSSSSEAHNAIYLLTAAHVALPGYRIQVVFYPNNIPLLDNREIVKLSATVVGRDVQCDLALLKVSIENQQFTPPPPLIISNETKATIGTRAYALGYPSGGMVGPAMTSGIVCGNALGLVTSISSASDAFDARKETGGVPKNQNDSFVRDTMKTKYVVTDAAMAGGMSGGPLIDADSGVVLGLNALINMELRALGNYAVSAAECINFLDGLRRRTVGSDPNNKKSEESTVYQVVLYNDRFNKRAKVQELLENLAKLNSTASNQAMMEAHVNGRGVVKQFFGDDCEAKKLCDALREEDLLVELEIIS